MEDGQFRAECAAVKKSVNTMKERGDTIVLTENGIPSGMANIKKIEQQNHERDVWEIIRISVLRDARGRHYGSRLVRAAVDAIRKKDANADILIGTSDLAIAKICDRLGFQGIPIERYYQITKGDMTPYLKEIEQARVYAKDFLLPAGQDLPS